MNIEILKHRSETLDAYRHRNTETDTRDTGEI